MNKKQLKWLLGSLKQSFVDVHNNILLKNVIKEGDKGYIYNDDGTKIIKCTINFESLSDGIYTILLDEDNSTEYFLECLDYTTGEYKDIIPLNERVNDIFITRKNQIEFEDKIYTITHPTTESGESTLEISETIKYLGIDNTAEYTPTTDYNPATKKYVDSKSMTDEEFESVLIDRGFPLKYSVDVINNPSSLSEPRIGINSPENIFSYELLRSVGVEKNGALYLNFSAANRRQVCVNKVEMGGVDVTTSVASTEGRFSTVIITPVLGNVVINVTVTEPAPV